MDIIKNNTINNSNQKDINSTKKQTTAINPIICKNYSGKIVHQQENLAFLGKSQIFTKNTNDISLMQEISLLNGDPFENANKIKNIILKNMGLPKDCIQIEIFDKPNKKTYCDYFNHYSGNILIHRNDNYDTKKLAQIIRHEIEHFVQSLAIIKYYGVEFYKELYKEQKNEIKNEFPTTSIEFNNALWNNKVLQSKSLITKEKCDEYINSINQRTELAKKTGGIYKYIIENYLYATDPMEIDAIKAENKLAQMFGNETQITNDKSFIAIKELEEILNDYIENNYPQSLHDDKKHNIKTDLCLFAFLKMQISNDFPLELYYESCLKNGKLNYALKNQLLNKISNYDTNNIFNDITSMTRIISNIESNNEINYILNTIYCN